MEENTVPVWVAMLDAEDLQFTRRFVLASGSLKALAAEYGVSYPTLRIRLDRLIAKIAAAEDPALEDPFLRAVQLMLADGHIGPAQARHLINAHKESLAQKESKS